MPASAVVAAVVQVGADVVQHDGILDAVEFHLVVPFQGGLVVPLVGIAVADGDHGGAAVWILVQDLLVERRGLGIVLHLEIAVPDVLVEDVDVGTIDLDEQ